MKPVQTKIGHAIDRFTPASKTRFGGLGCRHLVRVLVSAPLLYQALDAIKNPQKHVERVRYWQSKIEKILRVPLIDSDLRILSQLSGLQVTLLIISYVISRRLALFTLALILCNAAVTVANGVKDKEIDHQRFLLGSLIEFALCITWWKQRK